MKTIDSLSWLVPMESNRIPLFQNTLRRYVDQQVPFRVQIIVSSRTITEDEFKKLMEEFPIFEWALVHYKQESKWYAPSKAFNEAFKVAVYDTIFVSFPEVWPVSSPWQQMNGREIGCYMCTVWDLDEKGRRVRQIIGVGNRDHTPAYYFMAFYSAADIRAINGWDEDYADAYWYDDDEFGLRMLRQLEKRGVRHQTLSDVIGEHQWHSRGHYTDEGIAPNKARFQKLQTQPGVIRCKNGIQKE